MGLIKDEDKLLVGMAAEEVAGFVENRALDGPQEHVLEHRIVRNQEVRASRLHLVAGQQLGIVETLNGAKRTLIRVLPALVLGPVPGAQAVVCAEDGLRLARPAAAPLQGFEKASLGLVASLRAVLKIEVVAQRFQPILVTLGVAVTGVEGAAGVSAELRWPARGVLEPIPDGLITDQGSQATELIVDQGVHRIEQQSSDGAFAKMVGSFGGLLGQPGHHRQQECFGLTRARAGGDDNTGPPACRILT